MITIQNQNFGVEIELTGITRQVAAQVIADYYGTIGTRFMGTVYKTYEAVDNKGRSSRAAAEEIWYSSVNDGYSGGISHGHYNQTRYHGINLHAFFTKGTVEFRLFNGTTHAGRIKAYIQFCLAMSAWSINCDHDNLHFKSIAGYTQQQKHDLMMRVLTKRLGMRGPEFKTARLHLTAAFETAPAVTAA